MTWWNLHCCKTQIFAVRIVNFTVARLHTTNLGSIRISWPLLTTNHRQWASRELFGIQKAVVTPAQILGKEQRGGAKQNCIVVFFVIFVRFGTKIILWVSAFYRYVVSVALWIEPVEIRSFKKGIEAVDTVSKNAQRDICFCIWSINNNIIWVEF